jgi:hypothetical protein
MLSGRGGFMESNRFGKQFTGIEDACALAQAIVDTVREPVLIFDKELRVIAASRSFYSVFEVSPRYRRHDFCPCYWAWCRSVCRCLAFSAYWGDRVHGTGPRIVRRSSADRQPLDERTRANDEAKAGKTPEAWEKNPAKDRQKDKDAAEPAPHRGPQTIKNRLRRAYLKLCQS